MSLGGGSSSQQQLDPALRDLFVQNYGSAQNVAQGLTARQFSGFTPEQNTAMQNIANYANPNSENFQGLRSAFYTAQKAGQFNPNQVTGEAYGGAKVNPASLAEAAQLERQSIRDVGATNVSANKVGAANVAREGLDVIAEQARQRIRNITPESFLNQNMQAYMNPYTQAVTEQSLKDLERSRQLEQQRTAAQATAAKAFGGSRQGVAEAETNRAYDENVARLVAQQNAEAFKAAQIASEADLARAMQAQQLNQAQDLATTQQGLALAGQFGIANQEAALRASIANQDAALKASLANQGIDFSTGQLNTQNLQQIALANQAAQNARSAQQASLYQQAGLSNADRAMQANLANQQAGLTANQQRIGAANQMSNTAATSQNLGLTSSQALAEQGALRQGLSQQQLDAIRNLPLEQQQILNQALGINVGGGSGMQSSSSSKQGLLGALGIG